MRASEGFRAQRRGRFGAVLVATLVTILGTVVLPEGGWARIVLTVLQGGMLWLAFVASGVRASWIRSAFVAWVIASTVAAAAASTDWGNDRALTSLVSLTLIAVAAVAILRNLVVEGRITKASVGGVLTVYLMIGLFFTYVYGTINAVSDTPPLDGRDEINLSAEVYFAFITLTTVGYGDLTPATDLVRGLAITQALIGQLYLVSVVALVVSNLGREDPRSRGGAEPPGSPDGR